MTITEALLQKLSEEQDRNEFQKYIWEKHGGADVDRQKVELFERYPEIMALLQTFTGDATLNFYKHWENLLGVLVEMPESVREYQLKLLEVVVMTTTDCVRGEAKKAQKQAAEAQGMM